MFGQSEVWKTCFEFPNYEVSNCGRIRHRNGNPRKVRYTHGYAYVCIRDNGKNKSIRLHRLVAKAFIPNPKNKPCINHIDGNKTNNNIDNLEWCTHSENEIHKNRVLGKKPNPPRITKSVMCVETANVYTSVKAAAENLSINYRHIGEVASGKRKTAGGFHWVWQA